MIHKIIVGSSGAMPIAMNLTVCKKQIDKQWREKVVIITVTFLKVERERRVILYLHC